MPFVQPVEVLDRSPTPLWGCALISTDCCAIRAFSSTGGDRQQQGSQAQAEHLDHGRSPSGVLEDHGIHRAKAEYKSGARARLVRASAPTRFRATSHRPSLRRAPCALAEDRATDAHHRRAFRDRRFEIVGHAHRQRVQRDTACRPARPSTHATRATGWRCDARSGAGLGNRHQAAQAHARQRAQPAAPASASCSGRDTALAGLTADVDLDAHLQSRQMSRALLRQPLCDLQPIHALHPVEMFGDEARLVALDRTDEVPLQRRAGGAELAHASILSTPSCA